MILERPTEDELFADLQRVVAELSHQFIFIDDGGAGHHNFAPEVLVQNHLTYTGVIVRPDQLGPLHEAHRQWLAAAQGDAPGVEEFHATVLVNPKKADAWKGVSDTGVRANHLRQAAELFLPHVDIVIHGHIGEKQYRELVDENAAEIDELYDHVQSALRTHRDGLEKAFHTAIACAVKETGNPTVVVQDEGRYHEAFKHQYDDDVPIWQGGVIYHPSHAWPGIQVADLTSFVLSRQYCIADKRRQGKSLNRFDEACRDIAATLEGRVADAWKLGE